MTEVIRTRARRVAYCAVCSYTWQYETDVCRCAAVPTAHYHAATRPLCPRCGKRAQEARPA